MSEVEKKTAEFYAKKDVEFTRALVENRYLLFAPRTKRDLRSDHPELREYPELAKLTSQEILFVWYMRCMSSPFHDKTDKEKLEACIDLSWSDDKTRAIKRSEFANGRYHSSIKVALDKMEGFELAPRVNAKLMTEKRIRDLREILAVDMKQSIEHDYQGDRKTYHAVMRASIQEIQELVKQIESGSFGLIEEENAIPLHVLRNFHKKRA